MPELPEVETVVRSLNKWLFSDQKELKNLITDLTIIKGNHIKETSNDELCQKLIGQRIKEVKRKGKWIFFFFEKFVLLSHLRMTGKYFFNKARGTDDCVIFSLPNNNSLTYCDSRGFGVFYLREIEKFYSSYPYKGIGKDLFDEEIEAEYLFTNLNKSKLPIKQILLKQEIVSGIGNIYASEILFLAKINPFREAKEITYEETKKIIAITKKVFARAIDLKGTSVVDFLSPEGKGGYQNELKVYMREGKKCYDCRLPIIAKKISDRSTFFCQNCQSF